jgi:DNA-binding SARP family transcriptional activator
MDKSESRAQANLRSCLWRMRQARTQIVCCSATHLWLDETVTVDLHQIRLLSRELMDGNPVDLSAFDSDALSAELLPSWYDDFVDIEREQLRQLRLHALEHLADQYRRSGNWATALRIALTAVCCEPLRESAHRMVMTIHIEEGNISEAVRQYESLVATLATELGIAPSAAATEIVRRWI